MKTFKRVSEEYLTNFNAKLKTNKVLFNNDQGSLYL